MSDFPQLWRPVAESVADAMAIAELRNEHPDLRGLASGIGILDAHLQEAFAPGMLGVIAAETGGGKSMLATQMATAFAEQTPVLYFILENQDVDVAYRMLANVGRADLGALRRGYAGEVGIPLDVYAAAKTVSNLKLDTVDRATVSVLDVARTVWEWKTQHFGSPTAPGGVVIVDQLSHLLPVSPNSWKEGSLLPRPPAPGAPDHFVREWQVGVLKVLAEMTGTLVIAINQLNENHGDGKPGLSSMYASRGINHKADWVLMAWRPKTLDNPFPLPGEPKTVANTDGVAWLVCPKSRHTEVFEAEVRWVGHQQRFVDVDQPQDTPHRPMPAQSSSAKAGAEKLAALRARIEASRQERLWGDTKAIDA